MQRDLSSRDCATPLVNWVKGKPLANPLTCIGDGHPGVWNLIDGFAPPECRREVLDWYHLMENLYKVGGSHQRLKRVETVLWHGLIDEAKASFDGYAMCNFLRKNNGLVVFG
ncbi:MAG: hypothetical protein EBE86_032140 [Hormoscilla sp. GUM202]|nr:hypothetical protein [Hormoscilla sp. GUM202]